MAARGRRTTGRSGLQTCPGRLSMMRVVSLLQLLRQAEDGVVVWQACVSCGAEVGRGGQRWEVGGGQRWGCGAASDQWGEEMWDVPPDWWWEEYVPCV